MAVTLFLIEINVFSNLSKVVYILIYEDDILLIATGKHSKSQQNGPVMLVLKSPQTSAPYFSRPISFTKAIDYGVEEPDTVGEDVEGAPGYLRPLLNL